jgi:hypothetical protein
MKQPKHISEILGVLDAITNGPAPDVAEKTSVDGLKVSTVETVDLGFETAIMDANSAHPVERYDTEDEAIAGHKRWVEKAPSLEVITVLGYGDLLDPTEVTLERMEEWR